MKYSQLITGLLLCCSTVVSAQINAGNDTTICSGSATLHATVAVSGGMTFSGLSTVSLSDDSYTGVINIGFPFTFYGNSYTQCLVSSNNYVTFDLTNASGYSPWSISLAAPNPSLPINSIFCPYQDINPSTGGIIEYGTVGTAPNRQFIVRYLAIPMFSCTTLEFCSAVILYEGSNKIETYFEDKPLCASWNGGVAIHGLQNSTGTLADIVPGRNYPTNWTAINDAWEFVPSGSSAYIINTIPYASLLSNNSVNWYDMSGTLLGTGLDLVVSPLVTTSYIAQVQGCSASSASYQDTVMVMVGVGSPGVTYTNPVCHDTCNGMAVVTSLCGVGPYTFNWYDSLGVLVQSTPGVMLSDTLYNACASSYTGEIVYPSGLTADSTVTLTNPPAIIMTPMIDTIICLGGTANYTAVATNSVLPLSYYWDSGATTSTLTTSPIVNTCYNAFVIDANGCYSDTTQVCVNLNPPIIVTTTGNASVCDGDVIIFSASAIGGMGSPYSYVWSDGASIVSTSGSVTVTPTASTTYCVSVTDGCETPPGTACLDVSFYNNPAVTFISDISDGCYPISVNFTNTTNPVDVSTALWNFGNGNSSISTTTTNNNYSTVGCFDVTLTITSPMGCVVTTTIPNMICTYDYPTANYWMGASQPTTVFHPQVLFSNTSSDYVSSSWFLNDSLFSIDDNTNYTFPNQYSGNYPVTLVVVNQYGCIDSITYTVIINDDFAVYVPNAFSPDGDGINEFFYVQGNDIALDDYELQIFNRWGNLIFESKDITKSWDGSYKGNPAPEGVYIWKLHAKQISTAGRHQMMGHISLLR